MVSKLSCLVTALLPLRQTDRQTDGQTDRQTDEGKCKLQHMTETTSFIDDNHTDIHRQSFEDRGTIIIGTSAACLRYAIVQKFQIGMMRNLSRDRHLTCRLHY